MNQGKEYPNGKNQFQDQINDPVGLVSNSVWRGIGFIGVNALILVPAVYFYELLPEAVRLVATPNMVVLFGFIIGALVYIIVSKLVRTVSKRKGQS